MRLNELQPAWLRWLDHKTWMNATREEATGIIFLCPVCWTKNDGSRGTHSIICWDPSVPRDVSPGPGRWEMHGESFDSLSLVSGSSSVLLTGDGCKAHFFIQDGNIVPC